MLLLTYSLTFYIIFYFPTFRLPEYCKIIMDIGEYVDWIHLAQDGDQWRDLVTTLMNLRIP
jgi:hypothetical protein